VPDEWGYVDALVLDCAGDAGSGGVELARIIGLVDYVNRTVLRHDEIEPVLRGLIGSRLVEQVDDRYRRTISGEEVRVRCPSKLPRDRANWIADYLAAHIDAQPDAGWSLPSASFESALTGYLDEMQRLRERG
jgi:hypothetical protein